MKLSTGKLRAFCIAVPLFLSLANSCWSQLGDFNQDGSFDCADIDGLTAEIVGGTNNVIYDLTGDGVVNADDGQEWLVLAGAENLSSGLPYLPGDGNLDGSVDGSDFMIWNSFKFTATPAWCGGDFSFDGVVDVRDFNWWNDFKFQSSGLNTNADTGPQPLDDAVEFIYDAATGLMSIDTNDLEIWCFSVFGVEPEAFLLNGGGEVNPEESIWFQDFFLGHSKWFSLDITAVEESDIALFATGLTADDFDFVSFGTPDGLMGRGAVTIVNSSQSTGSPAVVPEPATGVWLLPSLMLFIASFRISNGREGIE